VGPRAARLHVRYLGARGGRTSWPVLAIHAPPGLGRGRRRSDTAAETPAAWSRAEAVDEFPELGAIDLARSNDRFYLMFAPDPRELRRYAFAQAAEAAVMAYPAEAVVWMRLVNQLDRSGDRIARESRPFDPADYMRASYLKEQGDGFEAENAAAAAR